MSTLPVAGDPIAEVLRHQFVLPLFADTTNANGACICDDGERYSPEGHAWHVAASLRPELDARDREVMASVAGEILDFVHTIASALAQCPEPYGRAGAGALVFERAARDRFSTESTTRMTVAHELACDHPRCRARVVAATINLSRQIAFEQGWEAGITGVSRVTDLCPDHRAPASAVAAATP